MLLPDLIGTLAAILTTVSFLPQAIMVLRTQETRGISLTMYAAFTTGIALWLIYGIMLNSWPMMIANAVTFCLALCILIVVVKNKAKNLSR